ILGNNQISVHGALTPTQTASVAKLITSLVVLKVKPLLTNQQGETITLGPSDVALYNKYVAEQGSVVPVVNGEVITEYQMLQAMLLPSANNMADSLAIWAYGSLANYQQAANAFLVAHNLSSTHVGSDASGFDPSTTSNALDLVSLGMLSMNQPVIANIVGQPAATGIPNTVQVRNVNSLLGTDGINGVKTGNTTQAGGVYVSASQVTVNGKMVTIITSLAAAPDLSSALHDSLPLIQSAQHNFSEVSVIQKGTEVAKYNLPWGETISVVAKKDLSVNAWNNSGLNKTIVLYPIKNNTSVNSTVGTVSVEQAAVVQKTSVPLGLSGEIPKPSLWWRLTHPTT
ncbi:MAG: hypothetical protein ACHQT9_04390, partial [Candidatus Saccharimonadales bacterium]